MLSEKLLLRKWKACFLALLLLFVSISPFALTSPLLDSAWSLVVRIGSVYESEGLFKPGAFCSTVFLQTALCSTLQWEDTWNFGWARGSHPCLGSKTVIDAFCVRRNQTPFFFFGRLESTMHPWSTEPCLPSYESVHKLCLQDEFYPLFCRTFVKQTFGEAVSWLVSVILHQGFTEPLCRDAW